MQAVQSARCKNVPTLATSAYAAFQPGGTHGKPRYMAHVRCLPMAVPRTPLARPAVAYPHKGEHMLGITAFTLNGTEVVLDQAVMDTFRAELRGQLLTAADAGYDPARRLWNAMIDKRPALIVRCEGAADVGKAVRFAATHALRVSVRGGGHNVAGTAVCDGGLMIDLSPMKGIRVDPVRQTAWAQAGLTWGEFDVETQAFGLATTGGQISTTGISGLTLGGGLGWLMRRFGLAVDNLL